MSRLFTFLVALGAFTYWAPGQTEVSSGSSPKEVVFRIIVTDAPRFPLNRLGGSWFTVERMADSAAGAVGEKLISSPLEVNECLGICSIPHVSPGNYRLDFEIFKLQTQIAILEKPILRLQIRLEIASDGIELRIIDTIPDKRSKGQPCLPVRRIMIVNSERDLDGLLRSAITPFLEEGRAFEEENLERAIKAINELDLFLTLRRSDCRVRLSQSPDDAVDVTFHLTPK